MYGNSYEAIKEKIETTWPSWMIEEANRYMVSAHGKKLVPRRHTSLWVSVPGDGFNHGYGCPECRKTIWLPLGSKPEDVEVFFCPKCGIRLAAKR